MSEAVPPEQIGPEPLLPEHLPASRHVAAWVGWLLLAALLVLLLGLLPEGDEAAAAGMTAGIVTLGLIGLWRWSWGAVHVLRALIYRRRVFPRLRAIADRAQLPPALYVVVTSYRVAPEMNAAVYGRLLEEVARLGLPCCIVAAVTDAADVRVLRAIFDRHRDLPEGTALHMRPQDGSGKRNAMADALRLIAGLRPPPGAQLLLMDGDTLISPGQLGKVCRVLSAFPDLGAVTTDNTPLVRGAAPVREWYRLRMAQRDMLMCSMSLTRRLLVLTGRFSLYRAEAATDPGFILSVERDSLEHWRLGRIPMLTGDDKSTWFALLKAGWRMLYVPDVAVACAEELPEGGRLGATTQLMARWYGNMVRNSGRALALGPRRTGLFLWLCLLDQRVSPWTTLVGPTVMLTAGMSTGHALLVYYGLWVLATRMLLTWLLWMATGRFHPFFPMLIYYNQVVGAVIKIFAQHNPDAQRWNRQGVRGGQAEGGRRLVSLSYMAISLAGFVLLVATISGHLDPEGDHGRPVGLSALLDDAPRPDNHMRTPCGSLRASPCVAVIVTPPYPRPSEP